MGYSRADRRQMERRYQEGLKAAKEAANGCRHRTGSARKYASVHLAKPVLLLERDVTSIASFAATAFVTDKRWVCRQCD